MQLRDKGIYFINELKRPFGRFNSFIKFSLFKF